MAAIAVCILLISTIYAGSALGASRNLNIIVLGDSLGDGMYAGLYRAFHGDKTVKVYRLSKVGTGLHNLDVKSWPGKLDKICARYKPDVAVVMTGGNDPQPIFEGGGTRHAFQTEEWVRLYTDRVNVYMKSLVSSGVKTFWVGLPVMREPEFDESMKYMNKIFQGCAAQNGVDFIPTRELTADEEGKYAAYGKDLSGKVRRLRANDGQHFTGVGYELLANHVLEAIKENMETFRVVLNRE